MNYLNFIKLLEQSGYGKTYHISNFNKEFNDEKLNNLINNNNFQYFTNIKYLSELLKRFIILEDETKLKFIKQWNEENNDQLDIETFYENEEFLKWFQMIRIPICYKFDYNKLKYIDLYNDKCEDDLKTNKIFLGCDQSSERFCKGYIEGLGKDICYIKCRSIRFPSGFNYQHKPYNVINSFQDLEPLDSDLINFNERFLFLNFFNNSYFVKNVKKLLEFLGGDIFNLENKTLYIKTTIKSGDEEAKKRFHHNSLFAKYIKSKKIKFVNNIPLHNYINYIINEEVESKKSSTYYEDFIKIIKTNVGDVKNEYISYKMDDDEYLEFLRFINLSLYKTIGKAHRAKKSHELTYDNIYEKVRDIISNRMEADLSSSKIIDINSIINDIIKTNIDQKLNILDDNIKSKLENYINSNYENIMKILSKDINIEEYKKLYNMSEDKFNEKLNNEIKMKINNQFEKLIKNIDYL